MFSDSNKWVVRGCWLRLNFLQNVSQQLIMCHVSGWCVWMLSEYSFHKFLIGRILTKCGFEVWACLLTNNQDTGEETLVCVSVVWVLEAFVTALYSFRSLVCECVNGSSRPDEHFLNPLSACCAQCNLGLNIRLMLRHNQGDQAWRKGYC